MCQMEITAVNVRGRNCQLERAELSTWFNLPASHFAYRSRSALFMKSPFTMSAASCLKSSDSTYTSSTFSRTVHGPLSMSFLPRGRGYYLVVVIGIFSRAIPPAQVIFTKSAVRDPIEIIIVEFMPSVRKLLLDRVGD